MGRELKKRGVLGSDRRITIPSEWKDKIPDESFYELELYGDSKVLVTFFTFGSGKNGKKN